MQKRRSGRLTVGAAILFGTIFLAHALNYSYFFVDDEAIPYVYAQNVLHGHGLVYSASDGPVEGYSDFLQVWIAVAILAAVKLAGLNKLTALVAGACVSLLAGVGLLLVVAYHLQSRSETHPAGSTAALAFLALCGPLALWSCSSLEGVTFAFVITVLVISLIRAGDVATGAGGTEPVGIMWSRIATACALVALLLRIDGFVYVGIVACAFLVVAPSGRRRTLVMSLIVPALVVSVGYHAWRWWYFRELLPAPLSAKVIYKLFSTQSVVTKSAEENYALAFLRLYGIVPMGLFCLGWIPLRRTRLSAALLLTAVLTTAYLAIVGDWMFGFRFFVTVVPVVALLGALTVSAIAERSSRLGWATAAICAVWAGSVAMQFAGRYTLATERPLWWQHRTLDPAVRFRPYYTLYEHSRAYLHPRDLIAYNQAGFLPFMLDVDNIDDLGICTRFYAELPTTDVIFTEVGRYSPLTNKRVFEASQAYLLYRAPKMIFATRDLIRQANDNKVPDGLLDNAYIRLFIDEGGEVAYARGVIPDRFRQDPATFLENVAHVSRLIRAEINGRIVPAHLYQHDLPELSEGRQRVTVEANYVQDLMFARTDLPVYELHIDQIHTTTPVNVTMSLRSAGGGTVFRSAVDLASDELRNIYIAMPDGTKAARVTLEIAALSRAPARVEISDLRVQGQPPELAAYVRRMVRFPSSHRASSEDACQTRGAADVAHRPVRGGFSGP